MRLQRLIWVYTCQNVTFVEISCTGSNLFLRSCRIRTSTRATVSNWGQLSQLAFKHGAVICMFKVWLYGSLSKNGGIHKGKLIKKYCPKFHFFSNIFINTNMEKIYGKYVQFKNMYNVSIVNYMDGTLAKMSVQSQTNFLIKNRQFKEFSKFKGVPLEILLKTLMGMNLGLFGCGTCKRNTLKIDLQ